MRKLLSILFAVVLLLNFFGCAAQDKIEAGNNMFTDSFFSDVVEICDSHFGQVRGDQMEPIILFLKGLSMTETDEHLSSTNENGEQLYGLDLITFKKSDGSSIVFLRNHAKMSNVDVGSYEIDGGNLDSGLKEAFSQAFNHQNG